MKKQTHVPALICCAALGCHDATPRAPRRPELPTVQVQTMTVSLATQQSRDEVVGTVRAKQRATLEAKVAGRIKSMRFNVGDAVKVNELVALLDAQEIDARLAQAQATLAQAKTELTRYESLLTSGAVTIQQVEATRLRFAVAKGSLEEAQTMMGYAEVRAPFAGVITHKMAEVGDLASPGRPLVDLEDPRALRLEVAVPEGLIGIIKIGAPIPVQIGDERDLEAVVAEIAPSANANSRTFLVKLDLPTQANLRPGQFGRAFIPSRQTEILRLPKSAILQRGQLELVFVVEAEHARMRLVKTGKRYGEEVEVTSGLEPNERIVANPPRNLLDGQPLQESP